MSHLTLSQSVTTVEKLCLCNFKAKTIPKSSGATNGLRSMLYCISEKQLFASILRLE